ncbi:MAG: RelA/SpoT domain-containing protein [Vicinamibacterales bacterium]|nr:RelA/SpoT domain-containing protein [Vicinamibacterales bacterium]
MAWAGLDYSKTQVDAAGRLLASPEPDPFELSNALAVLNNWRSAHSFPLNTFQMGLRGRAQSVYEHALVAQRLKRTPSIVLKLQRFPTMNLSRMQDIGGCRAVVATSRQVVALQQRYVRSGLKHQLVNQKNYLDDPQESGYRGVHLIYKYESDRSPTYNGRLIEMQLRSRLQHAWATAVETVGTFLQQSLKSSQGSADWLRFFALASSAFAVYERTAHVPGTPTKRSELIDELTALGKAIDVRRRLRTYGTALNVAQDAGGKEAHYFLLSLQPVEGKLAVRTFRRNELTQATDAYLTEEKVSAEMVGSEVVLVSVDSLESLRRAYPNYFLDTEVFFRALQRITGRTFGVPARRAGSG